MAGSLNAGPGLADSPILEGEVHLTLSYLFRGLVSHLSIVSGKREQETPAESDSFCACSTPLSGWNECPRGGSLLPISSW